MYDNSRRKAIPATCHLHRGPMGFANLRVSKHHGTIVFDPHVIGSCLISLDEDGATTLRDLPDRLAAVNRGKRPRPEGPASGRVTPS